MGCYPARSAKSLGSGTGRDVRASSVISRRRSRFASTASASICGTEPGRTGHRVTPSRRESPAYPDSARLHGVRVLVLDDEPDIRDAISQVLRYFGGRVTAVG